MSEATFTAADVVRLICGKECNKKHAHLCIYCADTNRIYHFLFMRYGSWLFLTVSSHNSAGDTPVQEEHLYSVSFAKFFKKIVFWTQMAGKCRFKKISAEVDLYAHNLLNLFVFLLPYKSRRQSTQYRGAESRSTSYYWQGAEREADTVV